MLSIVKIICKIIGHISDERADIQSIDKARYRKLYKVKHDNLTTIYSIAIVFKKRFFSPFFMLLSINTFNKESMIFTFQQSKVMKLFFSYFL